MDEKWRRAFFTICGDPVGKGRPKFSTRNGFPQAVTPQKTVNFENLVRLEYESQCKGIYFKSEDALRLTVDVFRSVNKGVSDKKKSQMILGIIRPGKKPDIDNIIKAIQDALNKVAFDDDKQIVEVVVRKFYDDQPPRTSVLIENIAQNG